MSQRIEDHNGYLLVRDNPITKAGVFEYLGRELAGLDGIEPDTVYAVYRPESELMTEECLASFASVPFIDEHAMLGKDATPAEQKGVHGVTIGTRFDAPYLRADLKIFSDAMQALIRNGKIELSPGYRSSYRWEEGEYQGKKYQLVQYNLRGNHLALVWRGRTGPDIAVSDHAIFTIDSAEITKMDLTPEEIAALRALLPKLSALLADPDAKPATDDTTPATEPTKKPEATDDAGAAAAAAETVAQAEAVATAATELAAAAAEVAKAAPGDAMDSAIKRHQAAIDSMDVAMGRTTPTALQLKAALGRIEQLETAAKSATLDTAALMQQIGARDALARDLSEIVGTFDHASMTLPQVAEYGVKKLGLTGVPAGGEAVAVRAYLQAAAKSTPTQDAAPEAGTDIRTVWRAGK